MRKMIIFTFLVGMVFGFSSTLLSQERANKSDYKLVSDDSRYAPGVSTLIFEYEFKGWPVKTIEQYFDDREAQDRGLSKAGQLYSGCGSPIELFNSTGKMVGKKVTCVGGDPGFVIIYSYFNSLNKVNTISGRSQKIVEDFAKGICPYAYHLYKVPECQHFDD